MRKFLYGVGAVIALLVVGGGVGLFVLARNGAALDAESKAYVDDSVVTITAHWSADELLRRSTPNFRQITSLDDLQGLFDAARTALGPLVDYGGSKGDSMVSAIVGSGTTISAKYVARAKFQKGDADLQLTLLKIDGGWKIEGFHINSNALMSSLTGRRS
jgi:hypothetical protein